MIGGVLALAALTGPVPKAGVVVVALLAGATLLARSDRLRAAAMLGALVLAPVLLLGDIWNSSQLSFVHRHPLPAAVAGIVALLVLAAVAIALARHPAAFGFLAVLALPFRIPVTVSGNTSNLLVPLYFVVAAGALAWLVPALRSPQQRIRPRSRRDEAAAREARIERSLHAAAPDPPLVRWLALALAATVVLYAIQSLYSDDFEAALQNIAFFYVPFALLFQLLRQQEWTRARVRAAVVLSVVLALIFAVVGFAEYATKETFFNSALAASNNLHSYFVINSIFYDPNIFGRYLALVMILVAVVLLYPRSRRTLVGIDEQLLIVAALAVLWACLVLTLSRSSIAALLIGLAVLAALRWRPTRALYVAVGVIVLGAIIVAITPKTFGIEQGFNGFSGGRGGLISGGASLFSHRPGWGYGSGSFVTEYRRHHQAARPRSWPPRTRSGDGRRRAGGDRPDRLRRPGDQCAGPAAARGAERPGPLGGRRGIRRAAAAHDVLRRLPRGPDDLGAARDRGRAGGRERADDRGRARGGAQPRHAAGGARRRSRRRWPLSRR